MSTFTFDKMFENISGLVYLNQTLFQTPSRKEFEIKIRGDSKHNYHHDAGDPVNLTEIVKILGSAIFLFRNRTDYYSIASVNPCKSGQN